MNSLESRKQLLVAESELNRAHLLDDMAALAADLRCHAEHARSFRSIASLAAMLVAGLAAFRCGKPVQGDAKPSWVRTILKGAGVISTLWLSLRSRSRDPKEE